jgi:hypothetical protein
MLVTLASVPAAGAAQRAYAYDGPLENVVTEWNRHAVEAFINTPTGEIMGAGQPPPISSLHLAMVHGAIYDAVIMIDGGYQPYLADLPRAPRSASKAAAVAAAAHDVLLGITLPTPLVPAIVDRVHVALEATLAAALAADGPEAVAAGVATGKVAAAAMLAERANDGRYGPYRFEESTEPGRYRFKPGDPPIANRFDWVAKVEPFLLESADQFRTAGPHALTSEAYAREYNEVKALGVKTGSTRTPAQEALAQFYNMNPVEVFFRAFRTLAVERKLTLVEQARLFAMLGMANADSLITCWSDKGHWLFWRPDTAIQNGEIDGNPATAGDPAWEPMLPDPPYPDHSSGFNCVVAALMHTAKAFFGTDQVAFTVVKSAAAPDNVRRYARLTEVIQDIIDVRVYHGVHFRNADVQGAHLGQYVADWIAGRYFRPMPAPPPTGSGGNLPGMPSTGAGGGDRQVAGGLVLAIIGALVVVGRLPRRWMRRA